LVPESGVVSFRINYDRYSPTRKNSTHERNGADLQSTPFILTGYENPYSFFLPPPLYTQRSTSGAIHHLPRQPHGHRLKLIANPPEHCRRADDEPHKSSYGQTKLHIQDCIKLTWWIKSPRSAASGENTMALQHTVPPDIGRRVTEPTTFVTLDTNPSPFAVPWRLMARETGSVVQPAATQSNRHTHSSVYQPRVRGTARCSRFVPVALPRAINLVRHPQAFSAEMYNDPSFDDATRKDRLTAPIRSDPMLPTLLQSNVTTVTPASVETARLASPTEATTARRQSKKWSTTQKY
jgi:hypothetical protein